MGKPPIPFQKIRDSKLDKNGIPYTTFIYKFFATRFRKPLGVIFENDGDFVNIKVVALSITNEIKPEPISFFIEDYKLLFEMINYCVDDYFTTYNTIKKVKINFS